MKSTCLFLIFLILGAAVCSCAWQQDVVTLDRRMAALERRNLDLEKNKTRLKWQIEKSSENLKVEGRALRTQAAEIRAMINRLREEIQAISGKMEESEFSLKERLRVSEGAEQRLGRLAEIANLNKARVEKIEQYLNLESSVKLDSAADAVRTVEGGHTEDAMYQAAKQKFDQSDYEGARDGFQSFIKRYPKSKNADNSQFWIGETYYREKWYEKAILEYQTVIEKYPQGNKVAAALLKQGFAFFNLGDKTNARLVLKQLIKQFPQTNEAGVAKKKLEGLK